MKANQFSGLEGAALIIYGIVSKHGKEKELATMMEGRFDGKTPTRDTILKWLVGNRETILKNLGIKDE